ncbi:MAG: peptidoglycan DD-metalloendopeptidase family protein [Deltaproteobacteria bacterium]|nr:peptidoglycan DD-metalloendopeptidase family protein [Deltaproteobacteria bacterium]
MPPAGASLLGPPHPEPDLVMVQHRVGPGETLYRIARTYGLPADALAAANDLADPGALQAGQLLVIPGASAVKKVVPPGAQEAREAARLEALARAAAAAGRAPGKGGGAPDSDSPGGAVTPAAAAAAKPPPPPPVSKVKVSDPKRVGPLGWPVRGVLYARFGRKGSEPHDGIDLAAPAGTPVRTAAPGTVLYAGAQAGYGYIVLVEHAGGLVTLYAHNRDLRVREGQEVREGQVVATVGETGKTSGPHLHFEVRKEGLPVDPLLYLGPVPPPGG